MNECHKDVSSILYPYILNHSLPHHHHLHVPLAIDQSRSYPVYTHFSNGGTWICTRSKMPLPSLHPSLPQNPTAGGSSSFGGGGRSLGSAAVASSANAGGSVNRDTLKGLQDVVWSDDEVCCIAVTNQFLGSLERWTADSGAQLYHFAVGLFRWSGGA